MFLIRTICALLFVCLLAGCASRSGSGDRWENVTPPAFRVSFSLKSTEDDVSIVELSEEAEGAFLRMNFEEIRYDISNNASYLDFKKAVLTSSIWNEKSSADFPILIFTGGPRDILTIQIHDRNLTLQGDKVPQNWKKSLLELAQAIRRADRAERDVALQIQSG